MAGEAKAPTLAEEYSFPPQEVPVEKAAEEKYETAPAVETTPAIEDKGETSVQDDADKSEAEETNTAAEETSGTQFSLLDHHLSPPKQNLGRYRPDPEPPLESFAKSSKPPAKMATLRPLAVEDVLRVNGSQRFAAALAAASPFASLSDALLATRRIWLNEVDVNGWLEAFAAHPAIGTTSPSVSKWSKEEQSAAISTATDSTAQELADWNAKYREKFGFVFMICASGRTAPEVLAELKRRYANRQIVELEGAAQEELKITELRLAKLFSSETTAPTTSAEGHISHPDKAADRMRIIGAHLGALPQPSANKTSETTGSLSRTRPPITTHVLDTALGSPASGIEVHLEMWKDASSPPSFDNKDFNGWTTLGSSITNNDGRSGQLMDIVDNVAPGFYRISFNTSKYAPSGFFPYVSIIFEIKKSQTTEHFHVPLLHSPFSFTTYRGS